MYALTTLFSLHSLKSKNHLQDFYRILNHEGGQIAAALDMLRLSYFSDPKDLFEQGEKKVVDINNNISSFIRHLSFLFKSPKFLSESPIPQKKYFWPWKELIFKWKDVYRPELEEKSLQMPLKNLSLEDDGKFKIFGDKLLLEQAFYNLVNNAVKYSYRGTKIRMNCTKMENNIHVMVTNYGLELDLKTAIFNLYQRGDNVADNEGLGVGLYLAKKIVDAHGGEIVTRCDVLSSYNVGLIEPYLLKPGHLTDPESVEILREEKKRLQDLNKYKEVIAIDETGECKYNPTWGELFNSIHDPTYEVTFDVVIPDREDRP